LAEKIISPGVFTEEIDKSFLPPAVAEIGAVVIGPTVKGPALSPIIVNSYSEFQELFGDSFKSGSSYYQYLTSHTAEQYLKNSDQLTVVRVLAGSYAGASATISSSVDTSVVGTGLSTTGVYATGSIRFPQTGSVPTAGGRAPYFTHTGSANVASLQTISASIGGVTFLFTGSKSDAQNPTKLNTATRIHIVTGSSAVKYNNHPIGRSIAEDFADVVNNSGSLHGLTSYISASFDNSASMVGFTSSFFGNHPLSSNAIIGGDRDVTDTIFSFTSASSFYPLGVPSTSSFQDISGNTGRTLLGNDTYLDGGSHQGPFKEVFKLHTLADGEIMNSVGPSDTNNLLKSGSKDNLRWEISDVNISKGTFTLLIRRGDDIHNRKKILETWNNLSLDPNSNDYIAKAIGDSYQNVKTDSNGDAYLQSYGNYPRKSKFVRVEVFEQTSDYLDENGIISNAAYSASLPSFSSGSNSGSFGGSFSGGTDGTVQHPRNFYENISENNSQGLDPSADGAAAGANEYINALKLISNQDEFDINLILLPGIISMKHTSVAAKAIDVCEQRGDCFVILDPVTYGNSISNVTAEAKTRDSSYAAMYWPWVKVSDKQSSNIRWVPPSVVVSGMYAFNDKVGHPWFAPAGLNRGQLSEAMLAERKLTQSNRDTLYDSNINPLATFPGQGVVVFGQKTLQKKSSALDRVNVRRLLIKVKKFIASSSRFLVFEQNTAATRRKFLGLTNPFLEQVKSQSGLHDFRVVMDEINNTPDQIDRNILYGQIFVQPTRTAEFIVLDFTVQPTGATFPE